MNLQKVGKFIAKMRKKVGLTQSDLGEALGVTGKAVSKWERGLNAPDITVLVELSKILNVTPKEILMGEEIENNLSSEDDNEITISSINTYSNYSKKKYMKIIIILVSIIVLIITAFSTTYFITNYNKCFVYKLSSADESYHLEGLIASNQKENSIIVTDLRTDESNKILNKNVDNYVIILEIDGLEIYKTAYQYNQEETYLELLKKVSINIINSQVISWDEEKIINKNKIQIKLLLRNKKNKVSELVIPIKVEKKFSNDKLFY